VFISFCSGIFFNLFLPSTIGGDLMRSIDLSAHTKKPEKIVATVLLDRLSGYIGLVITTFLALAFGWKFIHDRSIIIAVSIIATLLVVILLVLFNKFIYSRINKLLHSPESGRIREAIKGMQEEIHIFRHRKGVIVYNLLLSVAIQFITPLVFWIIGLSLGIRINPIYYFVFLPIIGAITLLPISIGGLGLREATTIYFFGKAGVAGSLSFAMSLLSFFFIVIYGALGGLIYVLTVHHRRVQPHKASASGTSI